jgi:FAD synthetase
MKYAISFNGGKESLIILHKYLDLIKEGKAIVFRIIEENEFEEISAYIKNMQKLYSLKIYEFTHMKEGINILKSKHHIDIIILGMRATDPNCENVTTYCYTDNDWPLIMRYSPLLEWKYSDVWDYIDFYNLPVCSLYEQGYTSLGVSTNTFPNFSLFNEKGFFNHARELTNESYEREGRIKAHLPISFCGKVVHGKGMGKKLGFATANLDLTNIFFLDEGVYCGTCILTKLTKTISGIKYQTQESKMVMSVGINPTFGDKSLEVHILRTYDEDFYGKQLFVTATHFIRKMKKFNNIDELIAQINLDIIQAKFLLS